MKSYSLLVALLLSTISLRSQTVEKKVPQEFEVRFATEEDKGDLVRLRSFLEAKDAEYLKIRSQLEDYAFKNVSSNDSLVFVKEKEILKKFLEKNPNDGNLYDLRESNAAIRDICYRANAFKTSVDINGNKKDLFDVNGASNTLDYWLNLISKKTILSASADNVNKDRDIATKAIQGIYNVEKGNQDYKAKISLYYAVIIFALILISFLFLFKKSSPEIGNDFLNGNGLQFIALFAIIISTILFGILGILEGKELAAILSGIAGFILGKGLNVSLTKNPTEEVSKKTETIKPTDSQQMSGST